MVVFVLLNSTLRFFISHVLVYVFTWGFALETQNRISSGATEGEICQEVVMLRDGFLERR